MGAVDVIAASAGVTLEPNATLALGANNRIAALNSDSTATTIPGGAVALGANTLTIGDSRNTISLFAGTIAGSGNIATTGSGSLTLSGVSTYTGTTTVASGSTLALASGGSIANSAVTVAQGGTVAISLTNGFSGFLKGEYRFAAGYNAGTVKGGMRYDF